MWLGANWSASTSEPRWRWRSDLSALSLQPPGHTGECLVHRGALRTLLGFEPSRADCEQWFADHCAAVHDAAADKIRRANLHSQERFHLTSRDINRALLRRCIIGG